MTTTPPAEVRKDAKPQSRGMNTIIADIRKFNGDSAALMIEALQHQRGQTTLLASDVLTLGERVDKTSKNTEAIASQVGDLSGKVTQLGNLTGKIDVLNTLATSIKAENSSAITTAVDGMTKSLPESVNTLVKSIISGEVTVSIKDQGPTKVTLDGAKLIEYLVSAVEASRSNIGALALHMKTLTSDLPSVGAVEAIKSAQDGIKSAQAGIDATLQTIKSAQGEIVKRIEGLETSLKTLDSQVEAGLQQLVEKVITPLTERIAALETKVK